MKSFTVTIRDSISNLVFDVKAGSHREAEKWAFVLWTIANKGIERPKILNVKTIGKGKYENPC